MSTHRPHSRVAGPQAARSRIARSFIAGLATTALAIAALVSTTAAQTTARASESATAPKISNLEKRLESLTARVEEARTSSQVAGAALVVVHGDEVLYAQGFGHRDIEKDLPVTPDTLFAAGSTTKAFTAALACMLDAEGKMSLDAPVRDYVPKFKLKDEDANEKVVIRDLLCHRTGLTRMSMLWAGGTLTADEIIERVATAEPFAPFRAAFLYNNIMYLVAGVAIGNATKSDWHTQLEKRLFKPLGMKSANTTIADMQKHALAATGYTWDDVDREFRAETMRDLTAAAPAGAINCSVIDMAQWIRFNLSRGVIDGKRLLDESYFDEMHETQTPMGPNISYGLGWMLREWKGKKVVEHGGNIDGFAAAVGFMPEADLGFALLMNVGTSTLQQQILPLVWETMLGDLEETADRAGADATAEASAANGGWSEDELAPYLGKYEFAPMGVDLTVLVQDGKLAVDVPGQMVYELKWPTDEGRWVFAITDQIEVSFELDEGASEAKAIMMYQAGQKFRCPRKAADKDLPSVEDILALRRKVGLLEADPPGTASISTGTAWFKHQGAKGSVTTLTRGSAHYYSDMDLGPLGHVRVATDGKQVFNEAPGSPREELHGKQALAALRTHPLYTFGDWTKHWPTVEVTGQRDFDGKSAHVVEVSDDNGIKSKLYIDAESGRILGEQRTTFQGTIEFLIETRFEDYAKVNGVELPARSITKIPQSGDLITTYDSHETRNMKIDDGVFRLEKAFTKPGS